MLADPLTKVMDPCKLAQALETNKWNLEQPINAMIAARLQCERQRPRDFLRNTEVYSTKYSKQMNCATGLFGL